MRRVACRSPSLHEDGLPQRNVSELWKDALQRALEEDGVKPGSSDNADVHEHER